MEKMEFTPAAIEQAINVIKGHSEQWETIRKEGSTLSVEEAAQMLIIDKFGDAQIEAEEIVNDLKKGLADFDAQYKQNKEAEKINIIDRLAEATKNNTEEERKNCYVNILTAMELLGKKDISEDEVNAKLVENKELTTEELLEKIEEVMNSTISLDLLVHNVKDELNYDILSQLAKEIELNKEDYRFMAALWLYIEQREGNLKFSDSDFAISAVELGSLAGASVEAIITNNALNEGKIDLATWQKVMKWILGAVIGIALGYLAFLIVANISCLALVLIWSVLGTGTLVMIFSTIIAVYVAYRLGDVASTAWVKIVELYSDFYNKHIVGLTDKISSWITLVRAWVANMVDKAKSSFSNNNDDVHVETQHSESVDANANENNLQGQPAMA